ncbi:MAG: hypothetical protein ACTSVI_09125 [Promethearchaeota archaeon]
MMEKKDSNEKEFVIFEPEAYTKALLHVLRFASSNIDKQSWVEVYGWLVGKLENNGNTIHIMDAVPIHHGKDIEVTWNADTYVRAAEFDEKLFQKAQEVPNMQGMFVVGWYHSHPGLDFFLSTVDVTNHLGFQGPNPHSIAIVFDHTKMVPYKNLGFKIFKLDHPSPNSGYHEVEFDKTRFTKDILDIIYLIASVVENIQGDKPFCTEYGEVPDIFSQLMLPSAVPPIDKRPPIDLNALFEKIMGSTQDFFKKIFGNSILGKIAEEINPAMDEWFSAFVPYLTTTLNKWLMNLSEKVIITNKLTLGSVYTIAGTLKKSMKNIHEWQKQQLDQHRRVVKNSLKNYQEGMKQYLKERFNIQNEQSEQRINKQDAFFAESLKKMEDLISQLHGHISNNESMINGLIQENLELKNQVEKLRDQQKSFLDSSRESIEKIASDISSLGQKLETRINESMSDVSKKLDDNIINLESNIKEKIESVINIVKEDVKNIGDTLSSKMNEVIQQLSNEKKELENLMASKSIKNMQKDIKQIANKLDSKS